MIFEGKAHGMIEGWKTEKSKAAFQARYVYDHIINN